MGTERVPRSKKYQHLGRNVTSDPLKPSLHMGRNVTPDPISQQMVSDAGYKDTTVADLQLFEDLLLLIGQRQRSSSSSDTEVDSCSKSCVKAYATLKEQYDRLGYDVDTTASPTVESFVILSDKSGLDKGYHLVPLPLTENFIPRKPDLTFMDEIVESENLDVTTVVTPSNEKTVENKGVFNTVEFNTVRRECCALINKELVSDGKKKIVFPTISKIEFVGPKQPEKPVRKPVKYAEMYKSQRLRGNQRN
ncbi:hypothetical protein Tco_0352427 [Tanacetum coccineum]